MAPAFEKSTAIINLSLFSRKIKPSRVWDHSSVTRWLFNRIRHWLEQGRSYSTCFCSMSVVSWLCSSLFCVFVQFLFISELSYILEYLNGFFDFHHAKFHLQQFSYCSVPNFVFTQIFCYRAMNFMAPNLQQVPTSSPLYEYKNCRNSFSPICFCLYIT